MEKILVTTDLSDNSKAGIRFAIKLAAARNAELIILHVYHLLRASFWSQSEYEHYLRKHTGNATEELVQFVKTIYRRLKYTPGKYRVAVHQNFDVPAGIIEFATANDCTYIVTSARGAGTVAKILGTNVTALIMQSPIPVITIPASYRNRPVIKLLYASDMDNYEKELPEIVAFAAPIGASVELLHLRYEYEPVMDKKLMEQNLQLKAGYPVCMVYMKRSTDPLLKDIEDYMARSKPSLLVLFTHQERSFFERLFLPANARSYVSNPKVPLLSFRKKVTASIK